ncbi:MAG: hypothetical protein HQL23_06825 [Candidatus Omnitrophica bacterium]|nr:hypothetical protein [Candidatus Omnitrophota bacterium]
MARKYGWILLLILLAGCTYEGKRLGDYISDPVSVIEDPHYSGYQAKRNQLERDYLNKKINFADYTAKVKELDEKYAKEVLDRDQKLGE